MSEPRVLYAEGTARVTIEDAAEDGCTIWVDWDGDGAVSLDELMPHVMETGLFVERAIVGLMRERDEARAEVARLTALLEPCREMLRLDEALHEAMAASQDGGEES